MSLEYSLGLCHESIRKLTSNRTFEDRLMEAFSEMDVSVHQDPADKIETSDEIFNEYIKLRDQYENNSKLDINELEKISEKLLDIIFEWIEYNTIKIHSNNIKEE